MTTLSSYTRIHINFFGWLTPVWFIYVTKDYSQYLFKIKKNISIKQCVTCKFTRETNKEKKNTLLALQQQFVTFGTGTSQQFLAKTTDDSIENFKRVISSKTYYLSKHTDWFPSSFNCLRFYEIIM